MTYTATAGSPKRHASDSPAQQRMNRYWSDRAAEYDDDQTGRQRLSGAQETWRAVWEEKLPPAPAEVLDLGTGSGNVAHLLSRFGHRVTGIDLADGMLERAREKTSPGTPGPRFVRGDAVAPPFASGSFDAVTSRYLLWTLRTPQNAFANWLRLLRPGGVLVAVDSTWFPGGIASGHTDNGVTDLDRQFLDAYDSPALRDLPLAEEPDFAVAVDLLRGAGFTEVELDALPAVKTLDERNGVAPGHRVQMQYRISARRG